MDYHISQDFALIQCGTQLDISTIEQQKKILLEALSAKKPIQLHANELKQIDTAACQLLLSFTLSATFNQISWQWVEPSLPLIYAANLLGVRELLKLPEK